MVPAKVLAFGDDIDHIQLVDSSVSHLSNAINAALQKRIGTAWHELSSAAGDLKKLAFDDEQREQVRQALIKLGVDVIVKGLIKGLLEASIRVFKIFGDTIVSAIQTNLGTAGAIQVRVTGS